ncbi:hypothetical protein MtrunA17_Chr7g0236271 [Medicago truncatula]|uniref:Leguminosin group567 LEED...PEED secreted peptide n=1 Tax=Medicago truncatula TaxID=3880 RepID=A0A072U0M1_MEDTR|nr:leguminosin group567 LEED...PEED secreted peptide [Medicago truncatula]RHN45881.1 hypothetical protein MtrunA17_Chr7g0236271 [Medicago truncatula]
MASKYSQVLLLLLGMMVLTTVVSYGHNKFGYAPMLDLEEDWPDQFFPPLTIIEGRKSHSFGYPPILDPEED